MQINGAADWRRAFPSQTAQDQLPVRWIWVALPSLAFCLLVPVTAALLQVEGRRALAGLLLALLASGLLGALTRTCSALSRQRPAMGELSPHPAVDLALQRLGRLLDEGADQRQLLVALAGAALDLVSGSACCLTLPTGDLLRVDRSGATWVAEGVSSSPKLEGSRPGDTNAVLATQLMALGENLGTLEVWAGTGQVFDADRRTLLGVFCSEAAVRLRNAALLSNACVQADALESKISDMERWQSLLNVYAVDLARTHGQLNEARSALDQTYMATLEALASAVDARDPYTYGHCRRVAELSSLIAVEMGDFAPDRRLLEQAALLHDIGKIGVPDAMLRKITPLTQEEWKTIQQHPELGYKMLSGLRFLGDALPAIRHHHEKYDGSGYPSGLAGSRIPLMARIMAVADAYDAITSDRPYRPGRSREQGIAEIERCARTHFDPVVVNAFLNVVGARREHLPLLAAPPAMERMFLAP